MRELATVSLVAMLAILISHAACALGNSIVNYQKQQMLDEIQIELENNLKEAKRVRGTQ